MQVVHDSGIKIESKEFKFIIDPSRKVENSLVGISHAHSDHVKKHSGKIISTGMTSDFFDFDADTHKVSYDDVIKIDDYQISLHNANHVLGSSQFRVENSEVMVYTGDFRLKESIFFPTCDLLECDTLVIESTYGLPCYQFQNHNVVVSQMEKWVKNNQDCNLIFGAYSLGKAQEVVKVLNNLDITPVVHPKVARNCSIYTSYGFNLDYLSSDSAEGAEVMRDCFVSVMPPNLLKKNMNEVFSFQNRKKTLTSYVTGWNFRAGANKVFCLSDHADFNQLIEYAELSNAKKIYTVHGFEQQLADQINKKIDVQAKPLRSKQALISDW